MPFEEIKTSPYVRFDKIGVKVRGYYLFQDKFLNDQNEEQPVYELELTEAAALRDKEGKDFTLPVGEHVRVFGRPAINDAMRKVEKGTEVEIGFVKESEKKVKGNAYKIFQVLVNKDNKKKMETVEDPSKELLESLPF